MKKELLIASALVSTLGAASVAEAITATMSGSLKLGQEFDSPDTGTDTNNNISNSNFSVSLSETTDGGTTISSSFMLTNESSGAPDDDNAIKLTFSDGSALELLNAGNASGTHAVSVPGAAGEQGVAGTTTANAPTGISFGAGSTALGIEWHSASDFLMDGLKVSASYSTDDGADKTATANMDSSWGVGATYVTDADDTKITIGAGVSGSERAKTGTQLTNDTEGFHIGVSAVTGDLTVAVGYGDGDTVVDDGAIGNAANSAANTQVDGSVVTAGISYAVSDDITLALGATSGEAKDSTTSGTAGTTDDAHDSIGASVTYVVADGISAILGYTTVDIQDEGSTSNTGGSAWYVGATMSF
tara:strand:+ start:936 stop:2012 length:1077 start_codon:yes stop_codon:yes gene_type:complete